MTELTTSNPSLAGLSTSDLLRAASGIRDIHHGRRVTFSPKVFIPLTKLCRDQCGYCTFAQPPARLEHPFLEPAEVSRDRKTGGESGLPRSAVHPRRTTRTPLSGRPELADTARLRLHGSLPGRDGRTWCSKTTGLLPHANAGALSSEELELLRSVATSQGMMIESLRDDLQAHQTPPTRNRPDDWPRSEAAGQLAIPFTTGILVGIGEDEVDRITALEAIAASHQRHSHIQEVIVQNFLPKPGHQHVETRCLPFR